MTTDTRSKTSQRIDLVKASEFDDLIMQSGNLLQLERVVFCPCRQEFSGSWQSNCPICKGMGFIYTTPQQIYGAVQSLSYSQVLTLSKEEINSTANLTLSEQYDFRLNQNDRITVLDGNGIITTNICKCKNVYNEQNKLKLITSLPFEITSIEYLYMWFEPNDIQLLSLNTDYTFSKNRIIFNDIINAKLRKLGLSETTISIRYYHKAIYNVLNNNHNIRQTRKMNSNSEEIVLLPLQYMIREVWYNNQSVDFIV